MGEGYFDGVSSALERSRCSSIFPCAVSGMGCLCGALPERPHLLARHLIPTERKSSGSPSHTLIRCLVAGVYQRPRIRCCHKHLRGLMQYERGSCLRAKTMSVQSSIVFHPYQRRSDPRSIARLSMRWRSTAKARPNLTVLETSTPVVDGC